MAAKPPSHRVKVRRRGGRGAYDRDVIHPILDAGFVGHLAFMHEDQPYAIPMLYAREDDTLYLHGSPLSRLIRAGASGAPVCFTVTLLDGLVLARSGFNHSVNYRSVVALGRAFTLDDEADRRRALDILVEHIVPGRTQDARGPSAEELAATEVLVLELDEVSAKTRSGPPVDAPGDYSLRVWAGEIPLRVVAGEPVPDARCEAPLPEYVTRRAGAPADAS